MTTTHKPNTLFWVIAILALLWNIMGIFQFIMPLVNPEFMLEGYSNAAKELFNNLPSWYWIFFGVATITGLIACVTQLLRKRSAILLFLISMVAVFIVEGYWILGTDAVEIMGQEAVIMPLIVVVLSIVFYFLSKMFLSKGYLR